MTFCRILIKMLLLMEMLPANNFYQVVVEKLHF